MQKKISYRFSLISLEIVEFITRNFSFFIETSFQMKKRKITANLVALSSNQTKLFLSEHRHSVFTN